MKIFAKLTGVFTLHWFYLTFGQTSNGKVAECMWTHGKHDCIFERGYGEDNQTVTKNFTLRIPQLFQNHTGKYRCVVEKYDEEECTLFQRTDISRCSAHATELMKEATVTCFFPENMLNVDFTVYREKGKVAECMWTHGKHDCTFERGYGEDNQTVTNNFTLRIPQLFQNHTGEYRCVVEKYDEEECTLFQRKATSDESTREKNVTTTQLVTSEAPSLPPPTSAKDLSSTLSNGTNVRVPGNYSRQSNSSAVVSSTPDENAVNDYWKAVGPGVGAVVLLLVSAVTGIVFYRKRRRVKKKRSCLPLAAPHTQISQKYVYSSVSSDVENGGVRQEAEKDKLDDMGLLTAEKNKIKSEDIAEAQFGSRVVNIKVHPARV